MEYRPGRADHHPLGLSVPARATRRPLSRLAWLVLGWNIAVILWGAFVRATGSGAGCGAHWPLCNGEVLPRAPALETMIEFTHRATSGVALLVVVALAFRVFRAKPPGHPARRAAAASVLFILSEAAVGAGLVLFRLVADNESVARALFMAVHLMNTFVLLACLALTAHWCATDAPPRPATVSRSAGRWRRRAVALLLVGTSGAIAALGDTLYPSRSILGGLAADVSPTAHFLVRLRVAHPLLALVGALARGAGAAPRPARDAEPAARRARVGGPASCCCSSWPASRTWRCSRPSGCSSCTCCWPTSSGSRSCCSP